MNINGVWQRTIWTSDNEDVMVIDQRELPHRVSSIALRTSFDVTEAIKNMTVRGAGLIGATAAWGIAIAAKNASMCSDSDFECAINLAASNFIATRPTASNLAFAVKRMLDAINSQSTVATKVSAAILTAQGISDEDAALCRRIGRYGLPLIKRIHDAKIKSGVDPTVNILTHCNAGWLAFTDFGSALSRQARTRQELRTMRKESLSMSGLMRLARATKVHSPHLNLKQRESLIISLPIMSADISCNMEWSIFAL